jgi:hypothetical protein
VEAVVVARHQTQLQLGVREPQAKVITVERAPMRVLLMALVAAAEQVLLAETVPALTVAMVETVQPHLLLAPL